MKVKKWLFGCLLMAAILCLAGMAPKASADTIADYCHNCEKATDFEILGFTMPAGFISDGHYTIRRCLECGKVETVFDPRLGTHTGGTETPTCTTGKTCSLCGSMYGILGHDWDDSWESAGDNQHHTRPCRREGCDAVDTADCSGDENANCVTLGQCATCGGQYYGGHHYSTSWEYNDEQHWKPCIDCDAAKPGSEAGHMIVENPMPEFLKSEANCVSRAVYYKSCALCRYVLKTETFTDPYNGTNPDNHDIVHHEAKAPSCTEIGWEAYDACQREGCGYTTCKEIPALDHDLVSHDAKAPTCTETGWEAYDTCRREGCTYSTYKELPARSHWYAEWKPNQNGTHTAPCKRSDCYHRATVKCEAFDYVLLTRSEAGEEESYGFCLCPVCGETDGGETLKLIEKAAAKALTRWLPAGELAARMGKLANDEMLLSIGFEYAGKLTQPTGEVQITLPEEDLEGFTLTILNADGTEEALPFTVEDGKAVFTLDFTGSKTPAVVLHLVPEA